MNIFAKTEADSTSSASVSEYFEGGASATFTIPANIQKLCISAGGGSGGFAHNADGGGQSGAAGRGGLISAVIPVGNIGGQLDIKVGRGADGNAQGSGYKPGGKGGPRAGGLGSNGGAGGGSTAVVTRAGLLLEAGAGGGAGGAGRSGNGGNGGHGGRNATNGTNGSDGAWGGPGGDKALTDGGSPGHPGYGDSGGGAGGGGGGRFGGGGGGGGGGTGNGGGGGGGGSSFVIETATNVYETTMDYDPPNSSDGFVAINSVEDCFKITSLHNADRNIVMAVGGNSTRRGTHIIQWPYVSAPGHHWHVVWVDKNNLICRIVSLLSGMVMAVDRNSPDEGAPIIQWPYVNTPAHHWQVVWIDKAQGVCKLVSVNHRNRVIAIAAEGPGIIQSSYVNDSRHHWRLDPLNL